MTKSYGQTSVSSGGVDPDLEVIPTGSLSLDYALRIGGWPKRHLSGFYGPNSIGKSSILGLGAAKSTMAMGGTVVWIAVEPKFDHDWAYEHGVDTKNDEQFLLIRPKTGEAAFEVAFDAVNTGEVDLVMFDSLGGLSKESDQKDDGKQKVGGNSGLITWGTTRLLQPAWHNNCAVLFANQIRDNLKPNAHGVVQPGGHGLTHNETIIVELRRGYPTPFNKYTKLIDGEEFEFGTVINAIVEKNSMAKGNKRKATFTFFNTPVEGYPFGVDHLADYISVGLKTGIIRQGGAWFYFGDDKYQGRAGLEEYFATSSEAPGMLREQVIELLRREREDGEEGDNETELTGSGE